MISNILRIIIILFYILFSKCPTLISIILSFIIENKLSIAKFIPILKEHEHELNITLYTVIFSKLISWSRDKLEKYIVNIECYFFENKGNADKEKIHDVVDIEIGEDSSRIYLGVKFSGYYKDLKNYYLEITFPTWIDFNELLRTSLVKLDEKEIEQGLSIPKIIIDFSKIDMEENNYKKGRQAIPLDFIINSRENIVNKESIEVKIKSKKGINVCEFKSNKLEISSKF